MKANGLLQCPFQGLQDFSRQMLARVDHGQFFSARVTALTTANAKLLNDAIKKTTNSDAKTRAICKSIFANELEHIANLELQLKLATQMREGLLDNYTMWAMSHNYMTNEGALNWTQMEEHLDAMITERNRQEGRAAADEPM